MARTGHWHSHKCAWHAALALVHLKSFLRPIIPDCLSTAESKLWVVSQGHLHYQVVLCNDFDCTHLTYMRALCSGVSVAVCDGFLSLTLGSVLESPSRLDEEHRLIARYAARLAAEAGNSTVSLSDGGLRLTCESHLTLWQVIVQCSAAAGGLECRSSCAKSASSCNCVTLKSLFCESNERNAPPFSRQVLISQPFYFQLSSDTMRKVTPAVCFEAVILKMWVLFDLTFVLIMGGLIAQQTSFNHFVRNRTQEQLVCVYRAARRSYVAL